MTMLESYANGNTTYLTVVQGKLAKKVNDDTPGATKREYETKDWTKWVKYEIYYKSVTGLITGLDFIDWVFWEQFAITLYKDGQNVKITVPTDWNYFSDFAKKLPNISLSKEVTLSVFDFEWDNWKRIKWVNIVQDWNKVYTYYYDAEKKKSINGFPEVDKKEAKWYDKDDWKVFFLKVKKFLKAEVIKQAKDVSKPTMIEELPWDTSDEISVEDIPF